MPEIWLRRNLRPTAPLLAGELSFAVIATWQAFQHGWTWFPTSCVVVFWLCFLVHAVLFGRFAALLAYDNGQLLIIRGNEGLSRIPIELVEGFLLGQGPSYLPGKWAAKFEVATLVIRLAERAKEWEYMPMTPRYGSWCHHYITFRGTYCERLSVDLVNRLNARLYEAQQGVHANEKAMA
jgi:hypothetical protein